MKQVCQCLCRYAGTHVCVTHTHACRSVCLSLHDRFVYALPKLCSTSILICFGCCSPTHSLTRLATHSPAFPFTHPPFHSLNHPLTHPPTHSLPTHPPTHSLTRLPTHSPAYPLTPTLPYATLCHITPHLIILHSTTLYEYDMTPY